MAIDQSSGKFMRVLFFLLIGIFISSTALASPVVAFSNIPPPTSYKPGGSVITGGAWKAYLFSTPPSSQTEIVSIKVGLTYCNSVPECRPVLPPQPWYPSVVDFQICLYSVTNQGGVLTPDTELHSIPMQSGLILTGVGTEFTFNIPNWRLAENTTYALVARSTDTNPVKWGNIELGGVNWPAQSQNGFSFNSSKSFFSDPQNPNPFWQTSFTATNNSVEMQVLFVPSSAAVPTLSEWAQLMLALMLIGVAWHFHNNRQNSY